MFISFSGTSKTNDLGLTPLIRIILLDYLKPNEVHCYILPRPLVYKFLPTNTIYYIDNILKHQPCQYLPFPSSLEPFRPAFRATKCVMIIMLCLCTFC